MMLKYNIILLIIMMKAMVSIAGDTGVEHTNAPDTFELFHYLWAMILEFLPLRARVNERFAQ